MKKLSLFIFVMMVTWMVTSCTYNADSNGCFGYTYETGLKRGTLLKNQMYLSPYRQCVETEAPHRNTTRENG